MTGAGREGGARWAPGLASAPNVLQVTSWKLELRVLVASDRIARAAARFADDAEQAWMLRQDRELRRSFAVEAFGRGDTAEQIWMLRQSDPVRQSYVRDVLEAAHD